MIFTLEIVYTLVVQQPASDTGTIFASEEFGDGLDFGRGLQEKMMSWKIMMGCDV